MRPYSLCFRSHGLLKPQPASWAGKGRGRAFLAPKEPKDSRHVSRGHPVPCGPCPGTPLGWRDRPLRGGDQAQVLGRAGGEQGARAGPGRPGQRRENQRWWKPEGSLATGAWKKKVHLSEAPPPPQQTEPSRPETPACPDPVTVLRALLEISGRTGSRVGSRTSRVGVGWCTQASSGSASHGVSGVRTFGTLQFQGQGEGMEVTPSSSPGGRRGLAGRQRLWGQAAAREAGSARSEQRAGRPGGAEALRFQASASRAAALGNTEPAHNALSFPVSSYVFLLLRRHV